MIYYSIIPPEVVFGDAGNPQIVFKEIDYMGVKVMVHPDGPNRYVVGRVLSTSPSAYLNPKLQPGSVIENI